MLLLVSDSAVSLMPLEYPIAAETVTVGAELRLDSLDSGYAACAGTRYNRGEILLLLLAVEMRTSPLSRTENRRKKFFQIFFRTRLIFFFLSFFGFIRCVAQ